MGGYPNAAAYRFKLVDTDFYDVVKNKQPYPGREGNPENSEVEALLSGTPCRSERGTTLGGNANNGEVVLYNMAGAPGFGDPIERDIAAVKKDLEEGIYSAQAAERVYGVISHYYESARTWTVDSAASEKKRSEIKSLRRERSVSFSEFHERERRCILDRQLSRPNVEAMQESFDLSSKWAREYREFWNLPEDFNFIG